MKTCCFSCVVVGMVPVFKRAVKITKLVAKATLGGVVWRKEEEADSFSEQLCDLRRTEHLSSTWG